MLYGHATRKLISHSKQSFKHVFIMFYVTEIHLISRLKVNNNDTRTTLIDIVLVSLMLTLNIFRTFSDVSIVDFDHGFVCLEFT